jgi:hypothetical protein
MAQRNPFYIRFSEQIGSASNFLKLFSPGVLEVLPEQNLWESIMVLRSAPGGGKTSLLRLFTPSVLTTLYLYQKNYKDLYSKLKSLGALDDNGPTILGSMLSLAQNYSSLEDIDADIGRKDRILISLLNARIVISALRSALYLKGLSFPEDLEHLNFKVDTAAPLPPGVPLLGSGRTLYDWAAKLEETICEAIDSLDPLTGQSIPGHDALFSLWLINPRCLYFEGKSIAERGVVMFDDVHKLTFRQRQKLLDLISTSRSPTNVWISERLEALTTDEVLSQGNKQGRDEYIVYIESYWHEHPRRFEAFAKSVADRRAETASEGEISSFAECLQELPSESDNRDRINGALETVTHRVRTRAKSDERFKEWLKIKEGLKAPQYEMLVEWRSLEILMEREIRKTQKAFDFDLLTTEQLKIQDQSDVHAAARLFLHNEFQLPYYYGFTTLSSIASSNIEQFLEISGELFEEVLSVSLLSLSRKRPEIKIEQQERILKKITKDKWTEIVRRVVASHDVRNLLESIGGLCKWETYKPSAPYSPGATGIAIRMKDRETLRKALLDSSERNKDYNRLARTITTCIAYNLLEPVLDYKCKGERWMVLYLNRMLCVHFDLPVQYGGWRERSLREITRWIEKGFRTPREETYDFTT